ncbi:hypothetical protein FGRA07_11284 [Fusarium graminearum]|nr:hypothetical protein FGRA07_11284 [Fusarium graminearum]
MESPQQLNGEHPVNEYYFWEHHSESPVLKKDFVFVFPMQNGHEIQSRAVLSPPDESGLAAMMVSIRPNELFRNSIIPQSFTGEILFLLDQSGSMDGCVVAVVLEDRRIACGDAFGPSRPTQDLEAKEYISEIMANMGGTDLPRALKSTVQRRLDNSKSTQIVILTDGELDPEEPMEFVWRTR